VHPDRWPGPQRTRRRHRRCRTPLGRPPGRIPSRATRTRLSRQRGDRGRLASMRCLAAGPARQPRRGKLAPGLAVTQLCIGGSRILITAPPPASGYRSYPLADQPEANTTSSAISPWGRNRPQRHHTPEVPLTGLCLRTPSPISGCGQTSCERTTTAEHNSPHRMFLRARPDAKRANRAARADRYRVSYRRRVTTICNEAPVRGASELGVRSGDPRPVSPMVNLATSS
jgi:hypothetical protein